MNTKDFHNNHFNSIQALRGIAALFVVLDHVRFINCGSFGVDIFFCISGFIIMYITHENTEYYLRKRLIRILPLYYIMTIGTFALLILFPAMFEQTTADPIFLIKSLLFIPFDVGNGVLQPLIRVGWSVNCEMFFYVVFWISFHISHKYRGLICSIMLVGIVILAQFLSVDFAPLTFYGNPVMLEFILGILCYYITRGIYNINQRKPLSRWILSISLFTFIGLLIILVITCQDINSFGISRPLLWGTAGMILVILIFVVGLCLSMPRFLVMIGNLSFSLYLMHYYPVMFFDRVIFDFSTCTARSVVGVIISIVVCLIASYISWFVIEKHFTKWLRSRFC